jgi:hypothetical protein
MGLLLFAQLLLQSACLSILYTEHEMQQLLCDVLVDSLVTWPAAGAS